MPINLDTEVDTDIDAYRERDTDDIDTDTDDLDTDIWQVRKIRTVPVVGFRHYWHFRCTRGPKWRHDC